MNNKKNTRNGLIGFLVFLLVLVIIAILGIAGILFIRLTKTGEKSESEETVEVSELEQSTDGFDIASINDMSVKPNGDAEKEAVTCWFKDKQIYSPQMTDSTISLQKADLSVFQKALETTEGEEAPPAEDGESQGPWEEVTLSLNSVDGSMNFSSPGDPVKTNQMTSTYMILVNLDTDTIVAERDCDKVVSPASMTKILTVLTAREYLDESSLDDKFTITAEITDYVKKNDCSAVGFRPGDEVTVRDLLYGTILCSGADAALGLAEYCAGTEEAFVDRMNQELVNMGLSETAHFTNVVGVYNEDLHCTMKDMAVILGVAVQDDLLLDVLSLRTYTTSIKYEELDLPDGIEISNWFLRRIEDKPMPGECKAAKTGFVDEAGCCAASYFLGNNGNRYICVTGNAFSSWRAIYDHVSVYRSYIPEK